MPLDSHPSPRHSARRPTPSHLDPRVRAVGQPPAVSVPAPAPPPAPANERERGLQELLHRLHTRLFAPEHVREAAVVVSQVLTHRDAVQLAQRYLTSPLAQVRSFAAHVLAEVERAKQPSGAIPNAGASGSNAPAGSGSQTGSPLGYAALADVIKQWIREEAG